MAIGTQGRGNDQTIQKTSEPARAGARAGPGSGSYGIGTPGRTCTKTQRGIATGERYLSALVQSAETGEYSRLDFAEGEWSGPVDLPARSILLGVWRGVMPAEGAKPRLLIDDASLMDLFEQAVEAIEQDPSPPREREAFLFVLTLILVRKRLLVVEKSERDAMVVRERAKSDGPRRMIEVRDPHIDEAAIAELAEMLQGLMAPSPVAGASA